MQFVSHKVQRIQSDKPVRVLFWAQDTNAQSHLAVVGTDPRGSGHFTYVSAPNLADALGYEPQPLKCTNRTDVLNWLERLGARQVAIHVQDGELPQADLQFLFAPTPEIQTSKRRRQSFADGSVSGGHAAGAMIHNSAAGGRQQTAPGLLPSAEILAVFGQAEPSLLKWVVDMPGRAALEEFAERADQLAGDSGFVETLGALDRLLSYGDASLQLLETSNLSPVIGRLRRHDDVRVASKAEQLAQRWHATALSASTFAKQHLNIS